MDEKKNENTGKTGDRKQSLNPDEQMRLFSKGKMILQKPIQDGEETHTELHWDFLELTGEEYVNALDMGGGGTTNAFRISNSQAFHLFAAAAGKATDGLDATDIRTRMGIQDAQKATQVATAFFVFSSRVGNRNISDV